MRRLLAPLIVFVAAFVAFWPALDGEFVSWDDNLNFGEQNPHYKGLDAENLEWMFTESHVGHWHPLTWISFAIDFQLFGEDPGAYHRTSMLLHAASAVLVYLLILRLLRLTAMGRSMRSSMALALPAATGALLFALHPLRVESVAWATERRDVLSGFFLLLSVLAWLRMQDEGRPRRAWYAASLALFALSLLSKAWGMTLGLVLLLLDAWPLGRMRPGEDGRHPVGRLILEKVPYLVLGVACAGAAALAQKAGAQGQTAVVGLAEHGVLERAVQAAFGLAFYLYKTLIPVGLSPLYELEREFDVTRPHYLISVALVLAITALVLILRRRWPALAVAWLAYVVIVSPVLGVLQSGAQLAADRYAYLSCIPFAVLAAGGMAVLVFRRRASGEPLIPAQIAVPFAGLLLVVLGVLSWRQTGIWRDSLSLWTHAARVEPTSYIAHFNLGGELLRAGRFDEAAGEYRLSIRAHPGRGNEQARLELGHIFLRRQGGGDLQAALDLWSEGLAEAPNSWGILEAMKGPLKQAGRGERVLELLREAIEHDPQDRCVPYFHYSLSNEHLAVGRVAEAARELELGLEAGGRMRPALPDHDLAALHANLGEIRLGQVDALAAERCFREALALSSAAPEVLLGLATSLMMQDRREEARSCLRSVLERHPSHPRALELERLLAR